MKYEYEILTRPTLGELNKYGALGFRVVSHSFSGGDDFVILEREQGSL